MREKSPIPNLYKEAQKEAEITNAVRTASFLLHSFNSLTRLTHFLTKDKKTALASTTALVAIALLPAIIEEPVFGLIDSYLLALLGGSAAGNEWALVSRAINHQTTNHEIRKIQNKEKIEPADLARLYSHFSDILAPKEINSYLRLGRDSQKRPGDPRLDAAKIVYQKLKERVVFPEAKKPKEMMEKNLREEAIIIIMNAQIQALRQRRSFGFIGGECLKKAGDWAAGFGGIGAVASYANFVLGNFILGAFSGLLDDAIYIGSIQISPHLSQFKKWLFGDNNGGGGAIPPITIDISGDSVVGASHQNPVGHTTGYQLRR